MSGRKFVPRTSRPVTAVQFWPGEWERMREFLMEHDLAYHNPFNDMHFNLTVGKGGALKVFVGHWVCVDDTGFVTVRDSESFSLTYMEER